MERLLGCETIRGCAKQMSHSGRMNCDPECTFTGEYKCSVHQRGHQSRLHDPLALVLCGQSLSLACSKNLRRNRKETNCPLYVLPSSEQRISGQLGDSDCSSSSCQDRSSCRWRDSSEPNSFRRWLSNYCTSSHTTHLPTPIFRESAVRSSCTRQLRCFDCHAQLLECHLGRRKKEKDYLRLRRCLVGTHKYQNNGYSSIVV